MSINGVKVARRVVAATNLQFIRHYSSPVCTPPRVRISFAEKFAHGVVMFCGILAIPTYILLNLKHYRPARGE